MVKGRPAIQAFWKGFMDAGMNATLEVVETETDGNLGVEVGKFNIFDPSGKTVDQGKYVVVWKKGKDGWKLYRDIWNSSLAVK
jgi:ketosteroid isomerase-like protein